MLYYVIYICICIISPVNPSEPSDKHTQLGGPQVECPDFWIGDGCPFEIPRPDRGGSQGKLGGCGRGMGVGEVPNELPWDVHGNPKK